MRDIFASAEWARKKTCEHCLKTNLQVKPESSRTLYPYEGLIGSPDDPKATHGVLPAPSDMVRRRRPQD